jgi:hypothetical protein
MIILYIVWSFGIFWYVVPRKIWQPCCCGNQNLDTSEQKQFYCEPAKTVLPVLTLFRDSSAMLLPSFLLANVFSASY